MALACHNYEQTHGALPPAAVRGPDGTPLLSGRVLILPYIEEQKLYDEFRLDEPWDSPHNLRLLERMPSLYAPPGRKKALVPPYHTICHVFVGPGTPFEDGARITLAGGFPDGPSNTLLFVEAGDPVPWTKPEEITFDPAGPVPQLRGVFKDRFRACTAAGSRTQIRYDLDPAILRAAITRNGGEPRGSDW
ncbi:MAG: DUF1559 domain-containing protein [Gemmataceae bacterium]|nr:DUF1559 domain-containing protein [Gemmataceae bacterium]